MEVVEGGWAGRCFEESSDFRKEEVGFVQDVIEVRGKDVVDLGQGAGFRKPEAADEADLAIGKDFAADPWVALEFGENTGDGCGEGFGNDFGKVNEEDDASVVSLSKHAHDDQACFGEVEAGEDF